VGSPVPNAVDDVPAPVSRLARSLDRAARALGAIALVVLACALLGAAAYLARPRPAPAREALFRGVVYTREVREGPPPSIVHTVTVDLDAPGVALLVTPGDPARSLPLDARTTSAFLLESHAQIAVNGDFFTPWYSNHALDFYPHVGDPVEVDGYAAAGGVVYSRKTSPATRTLRVSRAGRPSLTLPLEQAVHAISGEALLDAGVVAVAGSRRDPDAPLPRTAVGLDREERRLFLFVVDGRQAGYSEGVGLRALAAIALAAGAWNAINLDGGGSSTLVAEAGPGRARQLSSPAHTRIPHRERPVANHLGVQASPL